MKNSKIRNFIRKILVESEVNDDKEVVKLKNGSTGNPNESIEPELLNEPIQIEAILENKLRIIDFCFRENQT